MRHPRRRWWLVVACGLVAVLGVACGGDDRGPLTADQRQDSCAAAEGDHCGGQSDGACYCDEACATERDCCADKVTVCGGAADACCDPDEQPGAGGTAACIEGSRCCADGTWACNEGDGSSTCPTGEGVVCEDTACCDPSAEPGVGENDPCIEGASCCANGSWQCNTGDGSSSCDSAGTVCE